MLAFPLFIIALLLALIRFCGQRVNELAMTTVR